MGPVYLRRLLASRAPQLIFAGLIAVLLYIFAPVSANAQCALDRTTPSVTICSPLNGETVRSSSLHVVAATTTNPANPVVGMRVYLDNVPVYRVRSNRVDTYLRVSPGQHNLTINAWDRGGAVFRRTSLIQIAGEGSGPVSVAIMPGGTTLKPGESHDFAAVVLNAHDIGVRWSVDGFYNGNTTVGIIDGTGHYTAPATLGTHVITASSTADPTKSDTVVTSVTAPVSAATTTCTPTSPAPSVTICSPVASSTVGSPVQVQAVAASTTAVTKFLVYVDYVLAYQALNTTSINTSLSMTAGTHNLTVQFYNGAWIKKAENITVTTSGVSISISPTSASVAPSGTQQFSATVSGTTNTAVTWSVDGITGGNSTVGTISTSGLYTAPTTTGTHTVRVTSVADTTKSASASVTVTTSTGTCTPTSAAPSLTICSPAANSTVPSPVLIQAAAASATAVTKFLVYEDYVLVYQALNTTTISTSISMATGTHNLTLQFYNGAWIKKAENITVGSGVLVAISPTSAVLAPNATRQFTASVTGTTNTAVTWSVDGIGGGNTTVGTISTSGLYTAPSNFGSHTVRATSVASTAASASAKVQVATATSGVASVLTYHNNVQRNGTNTNEITLTPSNVNQSQFGKLYSYLVDGNIYAQPLVMSNVNIAGGTHNVVFVATENDSVYAFDADGLSTTPLWKRTVEASVANSDSQGPSPRIGITSTPVIDPNTGTLYVVAETLISGVRAWRLHALDLATGNDKATPVRVNATVAGTGADNVSGQITLEQACYQREALALGNGNVYIGFGHCNHGWLFAYNASTLARVAVWNSTPNGAGGAIWNSGGAPAFDSSGDLYFITGVDFNDPLSGYNDAFMRMSQGLSVLDYFIPSNAATLSANDADLGSGNVVLMPDNASTHPHEVIGGGKDGRIFVVNRDNMGKYSTTANNVIQIVQTGVQQYDNIFDTPAYWNGSLYLHCEKDVARAFSWSSTTGLISTSPTSTGNSVYGEHGATPSVSANGSNAAIVWEIETTNWATSGPAVLHAYDATNLGNQLYNSTQAGSRDAAGPAIKFQVPTVANGKVYVGTSNQLNIYGLF